MATLEEIQKQITEVKSKIPALQTGIEALSASDLTANNVTPTLPTSTAVNGTQAITSANGVGDMSQALLAQMQKDQDAYTAQQTENKGLIAKFLDSRKSQSSILAEQQEKWGMSDMFKQIQDITALTLPLQKQLTDINTQQTNELDALQERSGGMTWAGREEVNIRNKYAKMSAPIATQLNAYAAQTQALQGNLSIANQFATQAVNAATYDQEFEYTTIKDFIDMNNDFLSTLKEDERFYFTNALNLSQQALQDAKADKTQIMDWALQYPGAGINITDTLEQANAKASAWSGQQTGTTWEEGTPTSYKEWQLAGSPGTFEEWKKGTSGVGGGDDWSNARAFIDDNPDASYTELLNGLRENTGLSISDAKSILEEKGIQETTQTLDKQGVIDWAKEQYDAGFTADEIKESLLKKNYQEAWINEAIDRLEYTWFEKLTGWIPGLNKY